MRRKLPAVLACLIMVISAGVPPSARAASELKELQTEDLQLVWFTPHLDYLAPHVARSFENSMDWQKRVLGWQPDGKTNVLLKDFGDYGNAGARSNPNNALIVDVAPLSYAFETFVAAERIYALMNHELIHVAQMDQWSQGDKKWRRFFGGKVQIDSDHPETLAYHYLTTPRVVVPRWFMEGTAVFFETWMGGGIGRAQGAFDEMVFRSMVRDNAYFYDPTGLVAEGTKIDYQVGVNNYLYGTRFISFLALTYSPDHVRRWVARTDDSERYYADQFEKVFGRSLESAWQDWIEWEKAFQADNLAEVARYPITKHKPLSKQGLGSISRTFYDADDRKLYAAFRYPGVAAFVGSMSIETGAIEPLIDIKGPMLYRVTSMAFDSNSDTVFYTTDNNSGFRDIMALDVKTKEARMLFEDARIGDLAFNPIDRSLWGMRHLNGLVTLVRMPYPYTEYNQIHTFPYGEIAYDLDISPDGKLLSASVASIKGDQKLKVIEIEKVLAGDTTPRATFDFGTAVPESFVFAPDSKSLYGSSYYTGVSNIYRYDLATQQIVALSNAETGYFRPLPLPDGRLVVFDYTAAGFPAHESTQFDMASGLTGSGFVPGFIDPKPLEDLSAVAFLGNEIAEKHPVVATWANGSPSRIDLAKRTVSEGDYSSTSQIGLQSFYPLVEGYKDTWAAGMRFNLSDPIGLDRMDFTFSYSPEDDTLTPGERTHFEANWRHRSLTLGFTYNDADFYDLFGPTKRSRKGNSWKVEWDKSLIFDKPKTMDLQLSLRVHDNLDTLPYFQDIAAPTDELVTGRATLDYAYIINSLGNVDEEKGLRWDLNAVVNQHVADQVPALYGRIDMGVPFLFHHSSIWLRNSAGYAEGDVADPFANFFFGGFGNNWVDDGDEKRYRDHFSFPGFDISEVGGRSYARSMLEWNLPPIRFRSIGTPANYLSWARPAFFAGALVLNPDDSTLRRKVADAGFQMDFQFYVMHAQEMTLSFGYALGFEDGQPDREEFMLSLKVLH